MCEPGCVGVWRLSVSLWVIVVCALSDYGAPFPLTKMSAPGGQGFRSLASPVLEQGPVPNRCSINKCGIYGHPGDCGFLPVPVSFSCGSVCHCAGVILCVGIMLGVQGYNQVLG